MKVLIQAFWPVIPVFIILFIFLLFLLLYMNKQLGYKLDSYQKIRRFLVFVGLMMSIVGILLVTMMPTNIDGHSLNLTPFYTIQELYLYGTREAIFNNIGLNILLFVPFGFFIYLVLKKELLSTIVGMIFSILIETTQYLLPLGRVTNIDDVILNVVGTIIGVVIAFIVLRIESFIELYFSEE